MFQFLVPKPHPQSSTEASTGSGSSVPAPVAPEYDNTLDDYWSDEDSDSDGEIEIVEDTNNPESTPTSTSFADSLHNNAPSPSMRIPGPPPLKRRRHDVPVREQRKLAQEARREKERKSMTELREAKALLQKIIKSSKFTFEAGNHGLQAKRARAIMNHLDLVTKRGYGWMKASETAALVQGFAKGWGSRLVRKWSRAWVTKRDLPESSRGIHVKTYTIFQEPGVRARVEAYLRSNKWAMDPLKLQEFSTEQLVPEVAKEYLKNILDKEMPEGLKRFCEVELFPRIHLKPARGWSISTCRQVLLDYGFRYTEHAKGLYFDGHERPDVVHYRQEKFLPMMRIYGRRLVSYKVGEVDVELPLLQLDADRPLVLVAHDEMTAQANDGKKKSWIVDGEQPLKKKGVGRGLHQSDVICSSVGWLKDASQTLEYGKNYEGYWTGELFVDQVCLIYFHLIT